MSFRILSHACVEIKHKNKALLVDPWLIGSCYWRSWWNYPPVKKDVFEQLKPDAIYITHVHWDHWHGPTLKFFLEKNIKIITHDEPNKRSLRDLKNFGFKNIQILKHNESYEIGEIKITPYQFGLFLNDSALVIETPDFKMLNANDCKIAGSSLEQIKNNHGNFDFALRSHSSANDRVCYKIEGSEKIFDNPLHYTRSFKLFMDNVKPKYAIPFASNHCHLHRDVFSWNSIINDPFMLKKDIETLGGLKQSEFKIMLSGDSWSKSSGFQINPDSKDYFLNKDMKLKEYQLEQNNKLEKYYLSEKKLILNNRTIKKFREQIKLIPKFLKRKLKKWQFGISIFGGKEDYFLLVDAYNSKIDFINQNDFLELGAKIYTPIIVFNSAVNQNMFHHSGISKRNKYVFSDLDNLEKWEVMNDLLEKLELEVFPITLSYILNIIKNYSRRWREIFVYFRAYILTRKGFKIYDVEEMILKSE